MSIEAHIANISVKRTQLKARIATEMGHPNPNFTLIKQLKKQNLVLKEQMQSYFRLLKSSAAAS